MSRPKRAKAAAPRAAPTRWARWRPAASAVLTLAVVAGVLAGLGWVGDEARRRLGPRDRYAVPFADVECPAPPNTDRPTFLAEVRYASGFPETFQLLAADTPLKLAEAFRAHPWVDDVDAVVVEPPARVEVRLRFRSPVLAVRVAGAGEPVRMVDAAGVLLPAATVPNGLPELTSPVPPPGVPAGQVWPEHVVRRAVELNAAYQPRRLEQTPAGWRLTRPDGGTLLLGAVEQSRP